MASFADRLAPRFFCLWLCVFCLMVWLPMNAHGSTLDAIAERGTLRVGVSLFAPWTFEQPDGSLTGFEIDVANDIARVLEVRTDFRVYPWEQIIPALEAGEIDFIAGGMAITPERARRVLFSLPYTSGGTALVTHTEATANLKELAELDRKEASVAIVSQTLAAAVAERFFSEAGLKVYEQAEEAEQALVKGEVMAYVTSVPEAQFLSLRYPQAVDLPLSRPLTESMAGMAVRKGEHDWLNFLNAWVVAREADGWLGTTQRYWFRSLEWHSRLQQSIQDAGSAQ